MASRVDRAGSAAEALCASPRVAMGTSRLGDGAGSDAVLDAYARAGGIALDCAAVYQGGESDRKLGAWLRRRGAHERPLLIAKGGHPDAHWRPRLDEVSITDDLKLTLGRLGVDAVDAYLVHRDDEARAVEDILAPLVRLRDEGLTRWIGVSNWRVARMRSALEFAPIDIVSNYFGLGVPAGPPPVPGAVSGFAADLHALLAERDIPLLAWSALSGGFFADPPHVSPLSAACAAMPESVARHQVLMEIAASCHRPPDAILVRWLATAAAHVVPLIGSARPDRITALMRASQDTGLDAAVSELISRCATGGESPRSLLLPEIPPQW